MKTQRILGILWLALFILIVGLWLWKLTRGDDVSGDLGFHPLAGLVYLFGVIASAFLIQGAHWARIAIGIIALLVAVHIAWVFFKSGLKWPDRCIGAFALVSVVLLFWPKHEPVA
jgi:hypothetical protein